MSPTRARRRWLHGALLVVIAGLLVACSAGATPTPNQSGDPDGTPRPKPTFWPGTVVLAVIKLGGADGEIAKAGQDFITAADTGDVELLWGAADGLIPVVEDLVPSVDPLEGYELTAELGTHLRTAYPLMLEGATLLRDSIVAGDGAGVEEGSRKLAEGIAAYAPARAILAELVPQALLMQRTLNL